MNEEPEAVAYTRYSIDCPACEDAFDEEADPAGDTVDCPSCGVTIRVVETR